jgi:hypothetical protein
MIHLGVHYPNPDDACSYYRGGGVIGFLRKIIPDLLISKIEDTHWSTLTQFDLLFIQRPFEDRHVDLISKAKKIGKITWVDHDDDFSCIPQDNPAFHLFANEQAQNNIKNCLKHATAVTCTTEPLRKTLMQYNINTMIIPNAHNDYFHGPCEPKDKRSPVILWRGTNTHQNDLLQYKEPIMELAKKNPDFEWHFLGYFPFFLMHGIKAHHHRFTDIHSYFGVLRDLKPSIVFCPLAHNKFNHAKSNILWIEAIAAGAQVVAPCFEEWKKPGVMNFVDQATFYSQMQEAIDSLTGEVTEKTKQSASYIRDHLSLSVVNQARKLLLCGLYDKFCALE